MLFASTHGGAVFVSVAQSVFTTTFISGIASQLPGVPAIVLAAGAKNIQQAVEPQYLTAVLHVYNDALISVFYVSIAMGALSILGALVMADTPQAPSNSGPENAL
ncbi:hypothetical protein C8J57DRAFT_1518354 [Mycena rebaudengoi]|nr:hypothetical protein C8J57DRAFT_1518354 [Mycena rebaudengoi]